MKTNAELSQLSFERARLYSFFSRIFNEELDAALLKSLRERCLALTPEAQDDTLGISMLRSFFQEVVISSELIEELKADFTGLFLGTCSNPAYPCESVYKSPDKLVMGECRDEVLELLGSEGLQKVEQCKEPEDHISVLFDFMVYLCLRLKEELDRGDTGAAEHTLSLQNNFYHRHILTWAYDFCRSIIEGTAHSRFYESIGRMLHNFLLSEEKMFKRLS